MSYLIFFGCIGNPGHYIWETDGYNTHDFVAARKIPGLNPRVLGCIDGVYAPGGDQSQGEYNESIVPPVRIVAWWDRTGDSRHGSNSALIGYGFESAEQMIDEAYKKFPRAMNRQPRPIKKTNELPNSLRL